MPLKKKIIIKKNMPFTILKRSLKQKKNKKERGHFMSIFYSIMTCVAARCVKN